MTFEGPDPSEALHIGEETLTPDELGRLASCMFELEDITLRHFPNQITEADVTPEQWQVIQVVKSKLQSELVDSLKQTLLDNRE